MFDFAIIGLGAAGMQLALQMAEDSFFNTKKILLVDKSKESTLNKTWCYWEQGTGKWDHLIEKSWNETVLVGPTKKMILPLENYNYKMLKSETFYNYGLDILSKKEQFTLIFDEVFAVEEKQHVVSVLTSTQNMEAKHIFDSRIAPQFFEKNNYINLKQHFKGWFVKTDLPVFKENQFTMMDFSVAYNNTTSFMYVLPISSTIALLEFTFFTKQVCEEQLYDDLIKNYISVKFPTLKNYKIEHTEMGVIPMSTYPFQKHHSNKITKIGTAGGWVRPSTGYSFKNAEKYAQRIIQNIKANQLITKNLYAKRFLFYDRLLLGIISNENFKGPKLFEVLFLKNNLKKALRFLDGETTFMDELKIMLSYPPLPFVKVFLTQFFKK